jgi:predicted GNAT family acetyltransferase
MRKAGGRDRSLLVDWQLAFNAEVGLPEERERSAMVVARRITRGELFVWEHGTRVAFAGFRDSSFSPIARIAPVYTPPSMRGLGYATAVVSALSAQLLRAGKRELFLTTDLANPISNRVYANIGFEAVADHVHLAFERSSA